MSGGRRNRGVGGGRALGRLLPLEQIGACGLTGRRGVVCLDRCLGLRLRGRRVEPWGWRRKRVARERLVAREVKRRAGRWFEGRRH